MSVNEYMRGGVYSHLPPKAKVHPDRGLACGPTVIRPEEYDQCRGRIGVMGDNGGPEEVADTCCRRYI